MTKRESLLIGAVAEELKAEVARLIDLGWQAELIVYGPTEIVRLGDGFKVALVVPIEKAGT